MKRVLLAAVALVATLGVTGIASAGNDGPRMSFPAKADEFQKRVDARVQKMKDKLEKKISEKQVPEAKAKEIRERFAAGIARVQAATKQATADGVVTEDEAKQVRAAMKSMKPHHGKQAKKKS